MKTVSKKLFSLLLVAILLVSALPFRAFADAHNENDAAHVSDVWYNDASSHWQLCPKADCNLAGQHLNENPHTFDSNGVCTVCKYECTHSQGTVEVAGTAQAATCIAAGKGADLACAACGKVLQTGATIAATGEHNYVNGVCSVCGSVQIGASFKLTLDANGGAVNGGSSMIVDVKNGASISVLPDATRGGYTFAGWYIDDQKITIGQTYNYDSDKTAYAKWTEVTYQLTVRRVLNGDSSTAKTIYTKNVPAGTPLLNYLNNNVTATVNAELSVTPGYTWQYNFWKDYSGTQALTGQDTLMNQAQTVFVNFVSNSYTLYFNANGGTVTPVSKTVYFGSKVGVLPTPTLSGKVFKGWKDANGSFYTSETVYQVAGDTSLTAVWNDEALVILYIYTNGNFSSCDRMILMDGFVKNNNISRSDVVAQVTKYYTPASGTLSIAGLFDDSTWASYRANTSKAGTQNIEITDATPNRIYVMVNNAKTGTTVVNGSTTSNTSSTTATTSTTGAYWVKTGENSGYWEFPAATTATSATSGSNTNPKTGDTAQIEVAAAVMVLAAAALITMFALRKKKA